MNNDKLQRLVSDLDELIDQAFKDKVTPIEVVGALEVAKVNVFQAVTNSQE